MQGVIGDHVAGHGGETLTLIGQLREASQVRGDVLCRNADLGQDKGDGAVVLRIDQRSAPGVSDGDLETRHGQAASAS